MYNYFLTVFLWQSYYILFTMDAFRTMYYVNTRKWIECISVLACKGISICSACVCWKVTLKLLVWLTTGNKAVTGVPHPLHKFLLSPLERPLWFTVAAHYGIWSWAVTYLQKFRGMIVDFLITSYLSYRIQTFYSLRKFWWYGIFFMEHKCFILWIVD